MADISGSIQEEMHKFNRNKMRREQKALNKAIIELRVMDEHDDAEVCHGRAEDILCEYLTVIGAKALADEFNKARDRVGFWYA